MVYTFSMIQRCQQCVQTFIIDAADEAFYQRIQVPLPTFCWRCRMQRRFAFRNERKLYVSHCVKTEKPIITIFDPANGYTVYDRDVWWSNDWNATEYGQVYDATKTFFQQWKELFKRVPHPAVFNSKCNNSVYCNHVGELNNCHLVFASWEGDNVCYATREANCKDSFDLSGTTAAELSYETVGGNHLYDVQFVQNTNQTRHSQFLYECRNVFNCFGSVHLRNKSYCWFNEQLTEAQYRKKMAEVDLGSYKQLEFYKEKFATLKLASIHRAANTTNASNSTGNNLLNTENCQYCFDARQINDCRYIINGVGPLSDSYDSYGVGANAELLYEAVDSGIEASHLKCAVVVWGGHNVSYSYNCTNCKDCFGCIGLRNAQYCILNKQYTKEGYERLVAEIKQQMTSQPYTDAMGRTYPYGEFFPIELSPFGYNETVAQEHFPLTQAEILEQHWQYKTETKTDKPFTMVAAELPDHIKDTEPTVCNETIQCAHAGDCEEQCTIAYKILPKEFVYLKDRNIALPRLCPNCRHFGRLQLEAPFNIWSRSCSCQRTSHDHIDGCKRQIMTSFAPERIETAYCEVCYQAEIS